MTLWLASASPRRADLLRSIGVPFRRLVFDGIDETPRPGEAAVDYVQRMAREKARAGAEQVGPGAAVLGADTSVVLKDRILGKPADADQALWMLEQLSGRAHRVLSAVSLVAADGRQQTRLSCTDVCFRSLPPDQIRRYVATGEPLDKAGAYGIQGYGAILVASLAGSYSGVVGLPLAETHALLEWAGLPWWQQD